MTRMIDSKNYDIDIKFFINEKKLIYLLILNGVFIIIAFIVKILISLSNISNIFSIIFFVTLNITNQ